ncbi:hypothetical protein PV10_00731 [Exophiala mesophila]|uniref:C2H2-type domain-containing protein n=1 Tax=Exophiala mesophila TaxID=212818 RepID=A0A0D2ADD7_EXOME|nr:uncharacterized protein PV10_00731 [Exophiala mesophila]KIV96918.1 hypothetical protein PV10_00731 [Exophiala mesophila]
MQPNTKLDQNDDYGNLMFTGNDSDGSPVEAETEHTPLLEGGPVTYSNAITQTTPLADHKADTGTTTKSNVVMKTEAADYVASPLGRSLSDSTETDETYCTFEGCVDDFGRPKKFSRKADVVRHYKSQHRPTFVSCPRKNCIRKGDRGFTRIDHLTEHLRGFHMEDIPKKASIKRSASTDDAGDNDGSSEIRTTSASAMVVFEFREAKTWNGSGSGSGKVDPECMVGVSSSEDWQREMKKKRKAIRRQQKVNHHHHHHHRGRLVVETMNMKMNTNMKTEDNKPAAPGLMMTKSNIDYGGQAQTS